MEERAPESLEALTFSNSFRAFEFPLQVSFYLCWSIYKIIIMNINDNNINNNNDNNNNNNNNNSSSRGSSSKAANN